VRRKADVKKSLYQTQLDIFKADRQAELDRETARIAAEQQIGSDQEKAFKENDYALGRALYSAYIDIAKGQIDRTRASAEFVQKAATAIGSIYTGVLALSFATDKGQPLPIQGIAPAVFMGVAIVLSTAFLAYITKPQDVTQETTFTIPLQQRADRDTFIRYTQASALQRMYLLQTSVISLGIGILLLPIPYLALQSMQLLAAVVVILYGLLLTFLVPLLISLLSSLFRIRSAKH